MQLMGTEAIDPSSVVSGEASSDDLSVCVDGQKRTEAIKMALITSVPFPRAAFAATPHDNEQMVRRKTSW